MGSLWRMSVFVVKVDKMLGGAKGVGPVAAIKIGKLSRVSGNCMEPFIEDCMKLGSHPSSVGV